MKSRFLACTLALLALGPATAQEAALVRSTITPQDPAWVGQYVPLSVELLTPGMFAGSPSFDLPEVSGVLIVRIGTRPTMGSDRIGVETYNIQRHTFAVFARRAGTVAVPAFDVRFGTRERFGADRADHILKTTEHQLEVRTPPGAEGLRWIVSTSELKVESSWDKPPHQARVGDAFTRTITLSAPRLPGMLLPPLPLDRVEGLGAYPAQPSLRDEMQRGAFRGHRVERVTYVCERPGSALIPRLVIPWWNVEAEKLERIELEAVSLEIEPSARANAPGATPASRPPFPWWAVVIAIVIGGTVTYVAINRAQLRRLLESWERERADREPGRFAALCKACRSGDARAALQATYHWMARRPSAPTTLEELSGELEDAHLLQQLEALQTAAASPESTSPGSSLEKTLRRVRSARRAAARRRQRASVLPPLHPQ